MPTKSLPARSRWDLRQHICPLQKQYNHRFLVFDVYVVLAWCWCWCWYWYYWINCFSSFFLTLMLSISFYVELSGGFWWFFVVVNRRFGWPCCIESQREWVAWFFAEWNRFDVEFERNLHGGQFTCWTSKWGF